MLEGKRVWNQWLQKDMGKMRAGGKTIYSFPQMKHCVYEMLMETAERFPDKYGLYDHWNRGYTYQQFLQLTDRFAAYLKYQMKVRKGSRVGLLLHTGIEFASAYFALSKLGAVAVPLPTKYKAPEIRSLIQKSDLTGILVSSEYEELLSAFALSETFILLAANEETEYGFTHLLDQKEGKTIPPGAENEPPDGKLTDEFILMVTSGTTAASKGVVLKNYNINHAIMIYQRLLELTEKDKTIIPVPIYHITGLTALLTLFVYIGGTVYLHQRYDVRRVLQGITENEITFLHGSATVFGLLLDYQSQYPALPSVRKLACGGSFTPVETIKKLHRWMPQMQFQNVYGMTETSSPATIFPYDAATSIYPDSVGRLIPGLQAKILDENGKELATGQIGTVYLKGANICEHYYRQASPLITPDGWLNTGDMGYVNEDDYIFIVDREKDMINRGGEKIWSTDVENQLMALKGIKDAAVVGISHQQYGEAAAALVVLERGYRYAAETIQSELKDKMASYKVPVKILFAQKIPKTPGMKTDKKKIQELFGEKE